ncbi:MAG: T9SS type A sorting domain-containing protein, partial [Bacteroidota bacterium]
PVGNTNYTPITIQNNGTSDDFSVQCLPEVLEDGISGNAFTTNTVNTTWLIEEAVVGGTNATITAQWTSAEELLAFDRSNAFIARHTGTVWDGDVPTAASGSDPYTITRAGITTFSPFAVGSSFEGGLACVADDILLDNAPLASGMYSTKASIESSSTVTAGSIVEFFAVEVIELKPDFHAQSGSDFSARIDDCEFFFFNDETIEQRTDETNESIERNTLPLLFPNPVGQQLNIRDGIGQAVIYNMLGQEMQAFEIRDELHSLDVSSLVNGQYVLLILRDSGERVTLAFVK